MRVAKDTTLKECRDYYIETLVDRGAIDASEARSEVQIILTTLRELTPHRLVLSWSEPVGASAEDFERILSGRLERRPLQYLLGHTFFRGLRFDLDETVLIPRPETELIVEVALKSNSNCRRFMEVGAGSGCISVSFLAESQATGLATDISAGALAITRKNAERHDVSSRLETLLFDIFDEGASGIIQGEIERGMTLLLSNPPYIPRVKAATLEPEVRDFEPAVALFGRDDDGAGFYRRFAELFASIPPGSRVRLVVEVGFDQSELVGNIFARAGLSEIRAVKDLAGIERVITALAGS